MYYECSYCPGPTSLPVVFEGLKTDMGYEGRCVDGPEIETWVGSRSNLQAADLIHILLTRVYHDLISNHIATVTTSLAHNYLSHNILVYEREKRKRKQKPTGKYPLYSVYSTSPPILRALGFFNKLNFITSIKR